MSWSLPIKTNWMKSQSSHEPSMLYAQDIYNTLKARFVKPDFMALEIGAAWGFSTLAILEAGAKHLTSVDPNTQAKGHEEALANGYENHTWTCCKSRKFWQENDTKFDVIYVDGSHIYEDVKLDLYQAWDRLEDFGTLMIDDWDHKNNQNVEDDGKSVEYGVSLACFEFWRDHVDEVKNVGIKGRVLWFSK